MKKTTLAFFLFCAAPAAADVIVPVNLVNETGVGEKIGQIILSEASHGVQLTPDLNNLPSGERGFHLHENGDCGVAEKDGKITAAGAAGNHYDPEQHKKHDGPWGAGHAGDLPSLNVSINGTATQTLMIKRLSINDFYGKALVIHAGGDNYSDYPEPLGGGGARIACGVVPKPDAENK
ncbi:MAG: superoxide dismutase [Cu-Zn] SodC [Cellvibrionaceae bacterium]|nr:superoxide dismutase [Cu-Zn] SodC [Cellvibrionaceae bacterium]